MWNAGTPVSLVSRDCQLDDENLPESIEEGQESPIWREREYTAILRRINRKLGIVVSDLRDADDTGTASIWKGEEEQANVILAFKKIFSVSHAASTKQTASRLGNHDSQELGTACGKLLYALRTEALLDSHNPASLQDTYIQRTPSCEFCGVNQFLRRFESSKDASQRLPVPFTINLRHARESRVH
jgi:hypothetical protein